MLKITCNDRQGVGASLVLDSHCFEFSKLLLLINLLLSAITKICIVTSNAFMYLLLKYFSVYFCSSEYADHEIKDL